jgi:hypothetical protein
MAALCSAGIRAAHGKYVIMGDSDDSYDFSRLDAFVEQLPAGYQLVGNRFRGGILPPAASAQLARRLAPSSFPAAVQPALIVPLSRVRPLYHRLFGDGLALVTAAPAKRRRL